MTRESGLITRGVLEPGEWTLPIRVDALCCKCGGTVVHWTKAARAREERIMCNGEDRAGCVAVRQVRRDEELRVRRERKAERAKRLRLADTPQARLAQSRADKAKRQEQEEARTRAVAAAELDRRSRCPRPDKEPWLTLEGAEVVVRVMRENGAPHSLDLHGYLCECGAYHVGYRTRKVGERVAERWGSAYGEAS